MAIILASPAAGQVSAPVEVRLQEVLEGRDLRAGTVLIEARRAYISLSAPLAEDSEAAPALAMAAFAVLPQGVRRLWLSWPGAGGDAARLFWRSGPVRAQAAALLERTRAGGRQVAALRLDRCGRLHIGKAAARRPACKPGGGFTASGPYD